MPLPESDIFYLQDRNLAFEVIPEPGSGVTCVLFPGWKLGPGYAPDCADMLLRLPAGYPDVQPDMWWFSPDVRLQSGKAIPAIEVKESHLGRQWQRWSRHLNGGQWRSGVDGLESYLAIIRQDLTKWTLELAQ